jgi:hypothetical protein
LNGFVRIEESPSQNFQRYLVAPADLLIKKTVSPVKQVDESVKPAIGGLIRTVKVKTGPAQLSRYGVAVVISVPVS